MDKRALKYLFIVLSVLLLAILIMMSPKAGRNCDEVLHYEHSVKVLDFYSSCGKDTSALYTPVTHLKYYGQSYDNLTTLFITLFNIEDVYTFRHFMSSFAGWLLVMVTALLAIWLSGMEAGIFVIILFAVSPVFIGHAQNNLKDVPFALGYIAGIYLIFRLIESDFRKSFLNVVLLILSAGFCISVRAGGLILFFYLLLFIMAAYAVKYHNDGVTVFEGWRAKLFIVFIVIVFSYILGILFWPYALQDPLRNPLEAYRVMARFPDTFRQIFEGRVEWSDYMPWYYLPKSMLITIPIVVLGGLMVFLLLSKSIFSGRRRLYLLFLVFTILFPVIFVISIKSNLYSSWRQFLFIYPGIVVIAASGYSHLIKAAPTGLKKVYIAGLILLMSLSPLNFMIKNYPYSYIYYNQLAGGLKGAYGDYETDYYFVSQREASEWLIKYLKSSGRADSITVAANFSVEWFFRDYPHIKTIYVRHEERSMKEWDYMIMTNRYIPPFQLENGIWPPEEAIHIIKAAGVPIGSVIERKETMSLEAWKSMQGGDYKRAAELFEEAIGVNSSDEMIFYNFAAAVVGEGFPEKADSLLKEAIKLNPGFDLAMMYLGNIAVSRNKKDEAAVWYRKTIECNRKYLEAYISLYDVLREGDPEAARESLRQSLEINPVYKPALRAMADSYRKTRPDLAEKYDRIANSITDKKE